MSYLANKFLCLLAALGIILGPVTASAGTIIAIDVGDGPVQSGFSAFPVGFLESNGAAVTHTYSGVTLTIDELTGHFWRARDRGDQGSNGTFTQSDLLRDFLTSSDGYSITAQITGLMPGVIYDIQLWSYDPFSDFSFRSDWTVNGSLVQQNYSQSHGVPLTNDDYRLSFTAVADSLGQLLISGTPQNASDGVRINAIQVSSANVPNVPEPSSLFIFGSFTMVASYTLRRRQLKV